MFEGFLQCYRALDENGVKEPLLETLRLFDLLSNGAIRREIGSLPLSNRLIDWDHLAAKRNEGIPLEYIIGRATFMGLEFVCSPDTLIPRQETELLAKVTLEIILSMRRAGEDDLSIIDMGTGCGNIAVSLAVNSVDTQFLASDISSAAVEIARRNVVKFELEERIKLFCGDLFDALQGHGYEETVDIVVCNPPYIPTGSLPKMAPEIVAFEPIVALDAGAYGIDIFRRLIVEAASFLRPGGTLLFEIGAGQDRFVERLFRRNDDYEKIRFVEDENGLNRVVRAVKSDKHGR